MIVANLAVDHLAATTPLVSSNGIYGAYSQREIAYSEAEEAIGLSVWEWSEFLSAIRWGDVPIVYGPLPHHVDAMAGRKPSGRVYALHNVLLRGTNMGWAIRLSDGAIVYVPAVCGNLAVSRSAKVVGHRVSPAMPSARHRLIPGFVETTALPLPMGTMTPLVGGFATPAPAVIEFVPPRSWWMQTALAIGIVIGVTRNERPPAPLPCSAGSNEYGGCVR